MKFSQRNGYMEIPSVIQKEFMDDALRNSLWNVLDAFIWSDTDFYSRPANKLGVVTISRFLSVEYFKVPSDERPNSKTEIYRKIRKYYFECSWYEVYDFLEVLLNYHKLHTFKIAVNKVLERELSGYRFLNGIFTPIVNSQEIKMLETAINNNDFPSVGKHLQRALELFSDRKKPDYRNSIKESISAVESLAKNISDDPKATLGQALKVIERTGKLHTSLREGFSKLYGYTSDEGGIRHAMLDEPNLTEADARYFLLSCTSFINYLKAKT